MLSITNLTRKYISRLAVDNVSLIIEPGRTYALLGPNGSGKTTLMKMIAGLTRPTSGEILFNGMHIGPKTKADIAYMPTESYFYNYMTIRDAGRYYADFFRDFSLEQFRDILARMELDPKDKIRQLSSGMNAKVRLALTLSRDAKLFMFDEPLNGVDILTRAQVVREIIRSRQSGRSMLISTHLVDELEAFVDDAIFMKNGRIERMGPCSELTKEHSLTELYLSIYGNMDLTDPALMAAAQGIQRSPQADAEGGAPKC
ncbi:MAG: ABC transporter ATP-binding protein [Aristaeellaceae bacterium]